MVPYEGEREQVIEWSEGALFAPPRRAWHQDFNGDSADTSRYLAIQDAGLVRTKRLHQIERRPVRLSRLTPVQAAQLLAAQQASSNQGKQPLRRGYLALAHDGSGPDRSPGSARSTTADKQPPSFSC